MHKFITSQGCPCLDMLFLSWALSRSLFNDTLPCDLLVYFNVFELLNRIPEMVSFLKNRNYFSFLKVGASMVKILAGSVPDGIPLSASRMVP